MYGQELNRSYFFAFDHKRGWGNTSYFTFFSEFNRNSKHDAHVEAGFLSALFALSVIGNVAVIIFFLYCKELKTATNYFVCNLALADLLLVTSGPFIAHTRITVTWTLGGPMCHYINYAMFVSGTVMIWTMAVVSVDRFICIQSKRTNRRLTPKFILGICVIVWIISFILFCPVAMYFEIITVQTDTGAIEFCSLLWPRGAISYSALFTVCIFTIGFIVPFAIITVNYIRIFKTLRTARIAIAQTTQEMTIPVQSRSIKQRNIRVVKALVILVVLFFLMMTPLFITFIVIHVDAASQRFKVPSHALVWTVILSYSNACINPFLYGYPNDLVKRGMAYICKHKKKSLNDRPKENLNIALGRRQTINAVSGGV